MARSQLQDKLWSDSPPDRGSASLRQALREIRQALGDSRAALIAGVGWVGLDAAQIAVDLDHPYQNGLAKAEFAADLDIRDPEFDDWLRDMRMQFENRPGPSARPEATQPAAVAEPPPAPPLATAPTQLLKLLVGPPAALDMRARLGATVLLQEACWRAAELLPAEMIQDDGGTARAEDNPGPALEVSAVASQQGQHIVVLVSIRQAGTRRAATVRRFAWPADQELDHMPQAIRQLTVELLASAKPLAMRENAITLWDVFEFDQARLADTDMQLQRLQEEHVLRAGTFMALRAYIRSTLVIERLVPDPAATLEEAEEIATLARIAAPGNATVLGISSILMTLAGKSDIAREFALLAEQADPQESFGRLAKSQALLDGGMGEAAYSNIESMRASLLASVAPATWLMRRAMTEVRLGLFEKAELSTATAHAFAPTNHAALRFLGALRSARGDDEGAANSFAKLRLLEPGFEPAFLANPNYPAGTLRAAGLIKG